MCNCGHDTTDQHEGDRLKKKAVLTSAGAAALSGIPAVFAIPGQSHHGLLVSVLALELGLVTRVFYLLRQRRRLQMPQCG